jgi:hypothetical protein
MTEDFLKGEQGDFFGKVSLCNFPPLRSTSDYILFVGRIANAEPE